MRSISSRLHALPREERIFVSMLLLAFILHALLLAIAQMIPKSQVPVQVNALNFRLGEGGTIERPGIPAELPAPEQKKPTAPLKEKAPSQKKEAAPTPKSQPQSKRVSVTAPAAKAPEPEQRRVPSENVASLTVPEKEEKRRFGLPSLEQLFGEVEKESTKEGGPSIGDLTEVSPKLGQGLGASAGAPGGILDEKETQAIRVRYEQQISGWVAKHRYYPAQAGGRQGRAVVRVRIDRQGYVRYYSVDQTSGYDVFDRAAIDMIRRASPMPSAPMNYPAGNLIEFLIPITFKP